MKGLVYHGSKDIRYEDHEDPKLAADTDLIINLNACAICGSDLHIYHGHGFSEDLGYCVGHEAVAEVGRRQTDDLRRGRLRFVRRMPRGPDRALLDRPHRLLWPVARR